MPFKSKKQQKWMFAKKPAMAKRWAKETPNIKDLPNKVDSEETKYAKKHYKKRNKTKLD